MHKGRNFRQLKDRWASPDFHPSSYAPARVQARVFVLDIFGTTIRADVISHLGHVSPTTGVITWAFDPVTVGIWGDWTLTVMQDACRRPDLRQFVWALEHFTEALVGTQAIAHTPEEAWAPYFSPATYSPITSVAIGPLMRWVQVITGGKPYH